MKKIKVHKRVCAKFYRSRGGNEPVRDWLLGLAKEDRVAIGTDIQSTEYGLANRDAYMQTDGQRSPRS